MAWEAVGIPLAKGDMGLGGKIWARKTAYKGIFQATRYRNTRNRQTLLYDCNTIVL